MRPRTATGAARAASPRCWSAGRPAPRRPWRCWPARRSARTAAPAASPRPTGPARPRSSAACSAVQVGQAAETGAPNVAQNGLCMPFLVASHLLCPITCPISWPPQQRSTRPCFLALPCTGACRLPTAWGAPAQAALLQPARARTVRRRAGRGRRRLRGRARDGHAAGRPH